MELSTIKVHDEDQTNNEQVQQGDIKTDDQVVQEEDINYQEVSEASNTIMAIVKSIRTNFDQYYIDENNVIDYVLRVMTLVEQNKSLSGFEKKAVVIEVLTKLVDLTSNLNDNSKASLKIIIKVVVPNVIESLISASKGITSLNKKKNGGGCFCC